MFTDLREHRRRSSQDEPKHAPFFGPSRGQTVPFIFRDFPPATSPPIPSASQPPSSPKSSLQGTFPTAIKDVQPGGAGPLQPQQGARGKAISRKRRASNPHSDVANPDNPDGQQRVVVDSPVSHTTLNNFTLNLPAPLAPASNTSHVLLGYLQFLFNLVLGLILLYLTLLFILTVQRDLEHRTAEYSMDIVQEIAMCTIQFKTNYCESPLPAMIQQCGRWELCMNRNPTSVGRAKVAAELVGEVVNEFIEAMSWKTLVSLPLLGLLTNAVLSFYRSRLTPNAH